MTHHVSCALAAARPTKDGNLWGSSVPPFLFVYDLLDPESFGYGNNSTFIEKYISSIAASGAQVQSGKPSSYP